MLKVGMHRILFLPDIGRAGYPANPKAGYQVSGKAGYQISGRIFTGSKISNKF
jgi:hypothetical protein